MRRRAVDSEQVDRTNMTCFDMEVVCLVYLVSVREAGTKGNVCVCVWW